ncbi:MAG: glycosyltransferase family 2 protein [Actinomycetota bacterium]
MPDVSIVIPTRNRQHLLKLALFTALQQLRVNVEIIVVDDASTDGTAQTVSDAGRGVRLLQQPSPSGVSATRNRGISEAKGEWIAFLDDDDLWAPDKLIQQLEAVTAAGRTWVYAGDVNVDGSLRVLSASRPPNPEEVMEALPRYNPVPTGASSVMVRADVLAEAGLFDPELRRTVDWDMWIRLARSGPPALVPHPLVAYRFHDTNIPVETNAIIREPGLLADRYGIRVDRAAMYRRAAWTCLRAGDRGRSVGLYARAVAIGDLRSVGRAAVALVHPAVGSDRVFRLIRGERDERWAAEAQVWLDELSEMAAGLSPAS